MTAVGRPRLCGQLSDLERAVETPDFEGWARHQGRSSGISLSIRNAWATARAPANSQPPSPSNIPPFAAAGRLRGLNDQVTPRESSGQYSSTPSLAQISPASSSPVPLPRPPRRQPLKGCRGTPSPPQARHSAPFRLQDTLSSFSIHLCNTLGSRCSPLFSRCISEK